jgi:hypothetical protein
MSRIGYVQRSRLDLNEERLPEGQVLDPDIRAS